MPCPWFSPLSKADLAGRPRPARAPLGGIFQGTCHARPDRPTVPADDLLFDVCNFGYGQGRCPDFPSSSEADAVRFTAVGDRLVWILEKEYSPVRFGPFGEAFPTEVVERQAAAFMKCRNR